MNERLVLIVEDDSRTRSLERFVLEEAGFLVEGVGSGEEAVQAVNEKDPTLVLLDIGLPGIDGFTTCQYIRKISRVPIIMVTGEDRDEDKVRGLELGADDYVTKPFSTNELAARVKAVLRRSYAFAEAEAPMAPLPGTGKPQEKSSRQTPGNKGEVQEPQQNSLQPVGDEVYEGTVKLVIDSSGYIRGMINFVDELRKNPQFRLLRLAADQRKEGMDIWLRLTEPLHLKSMVLQMEGVSRVETPADPEGDAGGQELQVFLGQ